MSQYINIARVIPSSKAGDFIVKFKRVTWLLAYNKYFTKPDEGIKDIGGHVPIYTIFHNRKKIGFVLVHISKKDKPYLVLMKRRQQKMGTRISGRMRKYYIFDLNDDYSPIDNAVVSYKVYSKTKIY